MWRWIVCDVVVGMGDVVLQTQQFRLMRMPFCSCCDLTSRAQLEVRLKLECVLVLVLFLSNYANNFCYQRDIMLTHSRGSVMDDALKRESKTLSSTHTTQPPITTLIPIFPHSKPSTSPNLHHPDISYSLPSTFTFISYNFHNY